MPATFRSYSSATISSTPNRVPKPPGTRPGDVLVAFSAADSGSNFQITLTGGPGEWTSLADTPGGIWAGTRVWAKTAGASEPDFYDVTQAITADGVIFVIAVRDATIADIVIASGSGITCPDATPATASGLEIRYAVGIRQTGGTLTWSEPSGYTSMQAQVKIWASAIVATKQYASSSPVGSLTLTPSVTTYVAHTYTVLVASASAPPTPEPPTVPAFAPGRGSALYQYVFRRMLDRTYLGHLDLAGVSFDKRIGQPGSFSATIPIPSRRVGDQVAEIIPRDEAYLDRGPGVISCEIYRAGVCWGEYWITSATISRSGRGTPSISLSGSTLDAYLLQVEIQNDLGPYDDTDQITIARALLTDAQSQPHANLSLVLQSGTSGVTQSREYLASENVTYGQRLQELAATDGGFEWMINMVVSGGTLQRRWVWGYPRLGIQDPPQHVFVDSPHGGDVLSWSEQIDALRGATRWRASGASSGSGDASTGTSSLISDPVEATAHLTAGWPRLDKTVAYSDVDDEQTLADYAAYWAATVPGALRVDQLTVALGAEPSLTPNLLGDTARIYLENEWHTRHSRVRRIIGLGITPVSRESGKEEAELVLEGREPDA